MSTRTKQPVLAATVEDDRVVVKFNGIVIDIGPTGDGEGLNVEVYAYNGGPDKDGRVAQVEREDWTRGRFNTALRPGQVQTFRLVRS